MKKYMYKKSILGWCVWQGKSLIAVINENLDSPEGVAEGICKALNEQNKYILPTKNYGMHGGGYIRELTQAEIARQKAIMFHEEFND